MNRNFFEGNSSIGAKATDIHILSTLKTYMAEQSLPLWKAQGWDFKRGGFVERLNQDGSPDLEAVRRLRVQARQIYSFAKAEMLQWLPGAGQLALDGVDYLLRKGRSPDGRPGYVHLLTSQGEVADPKRDTYDHAFVLLGLAMAYQLGRDSQIRAEIDSVIAVLDEMRSPHGGYVESLPPALPRRQNPHMHLFEAMLALYEATGDGTFLARAGELYGLFTTCLFDPETKTLGEFFSEDWKKVTGSSGDVEPGHQAEWVWLLMWYERISGCPTAGYRKSLLESATRYSDVTTQCLVDEGDTDGKIVKSTRRCWPQTECAKAWIAQTESGEPGADIMAFEALARLKKYYLDHPLPGGWYDQFDESGRSLVEAIPASTMYHVICAVAEADTVFGKRAAQ